MHKHFKKIISLLMMISLLTSFMMPVLAEDAEKAETPEIRQLTISSMEDFEAFREACVRDIYSRDLEVTLKTDLNFSGREFSAIPSFSGTFNGNHHTIKGILLKTEGSGQGLFRYLTDTAVVKDLTVMGEILPAGSKSIAGGIAGTNGGLIRNCRFKGIAAGTESIGGIAGINESSGIIEDCMVSGAVQGSHFAGGMAGKNYGVIRSCKNLSSINVKEEDNKIESVTFDPDFIMGKEAVDTSTDLGGIAGISSGVIRDCANHGNVGYPKMGYNLGGICGSLKGYVVNCKNFGKIQGRKEIAGIAGQLEPVVEIDFQQDTIQILKNQLNTTSALANRASSNIHENSKDLQYYISDLHGDAETAVDALNSLIPHDGELPDHDTVIAAHNTISSSVGSMQNSLSNINDSAQAVIGTAAADIRAINNSIAEISNTLDHAADTLGGTVTDISDLDTEEDLTGKIQDCHNSGPISADLNAGGIAGAVAWENDMDPEDDYSVSGDHSLNFDSRLRAVILNCGNAALIQVNKRNAGGIAGNMSLGLAKNCVNTGFIQGEKADFIGGIAGSSLGFIRDCSVKGKLRGHSYMGGIAGSASIVSGCRSTVMMEDGAERLGSVIGYPEEDKTESENPIHNNYYLPLADHLGAIDGIDYYEKADSLQRQDFLTLPGLSPLFSSASLTFQYPDGSTQKVVVPLGDVVPEEKIPAPPRKAGYIGKWDMLEELDLDHMFFNVTLEAEYTPTNTVVESDIKTKDGKPVLLAEGSFLEQETVELTAFPEMPDRYKVQEAWTLPDFGQEGETLIHLAVPEEISLKDAKAIVLTADGIWEEREAAEDGSYLIFSVSAQDQAVAVSKSRTRLISEILTIAGGTAGLLFLVILILVLHKKKAKKQNRPKE